ncbi:hypothetical protein AVEN_117095-1, partial [Araneus ventricosus]
MAGRMAKHIVRSRIRSYVGSGPRLPPGITDGRRGFHL